MNIKPKSSLAKLVYDSLPRNEPFTLADVIAAMKANDPDRQFSEPSVRTNLSRLMHRGAVEKIRSASPEQCAVYLTVDIELEFIEPIAIDFAEQVLREIGPCDALTLLFSMQERGFRSERDDKAAMNSLVRSMGRNPIFCDRDGGWTLKI